MADARHVDVAIVGAGFCGTMVAIHLARRAPSLKIALIEQAATAGRGLAYGTEDPGHLLNVYAGQMGAFNDKPQEFWEWLRKQASFADAAAQSYVPRQMYGAYLQHLLSEARGAHPLLNVFNRRIDDMHAPPQGGYELIDSDGKILTANRVVLALGNFMPGSPAGSAPALNPYAPETWRRLADDGDVLLVGTGLTCLDLIVTLAKTKPKGKIHVLSRRGLLPRPHTDAQAYTLKLKAPYPTTARGLMRALRREISEANGVRWQSVIDALRPYNQIVWQALTLDEQRRFLRHAKPYWGAHRHRAPPQILDLYHGLEKQGRAVLHSGKIISQTPHAEGWNVAWRPRGEAAAQNLIVRHVVSCIGPEADIGKADNLLVRNLIKNKMIAPDKLGIGIATEGYEVCGASGRKTKGIYTLGSLLRGKLYESIAVREFRVQAEDVAALIAAD